MIGSTLVRGLDPRYLRSAPIHLRVLLYQPRSSATGPTFKFKLSYETC